MRGGGRRPVSRSLHAVCSRQERCIKKCVPGWRRTSVQSRPTCGPNTTPRAPVSAHPHLTVIFADQEAQTVFALPFTSPPKRHAQPSGPAREQLRGPTCSLLCYSIPPSRLHPNHTTPHHPPVTLRVLSLHARRPLAPSASFCSDLSVFFPPGLSPTDESWSALNRAESRCNHSPCAAAAITHARSLFSFRLLS